MHMDHITPVSLTDMVFFTGSEFSEGNFVAKVKMEVVVEKNQVCRHFVLTLLLSRLYLTSFSY